MIYLHKLLPLIASPIGVVTLLLLTGVFLRQRKIIVSAMCLLLVSCLPLTGHLIYYALEADNPPKKFEAIGNHQGVVVLSGSVRTLEVDDNIFVEWSDPDRFFAGLNAFQSKKVDKVIFTRGKMPWSNSMPEGEVLRESAIDFGIPPDKILLTSVVSNTAEEAVAVKTLINSERIKSILLVTSSFHMPRAELLFRQQGIALETFPVDFKALGHHINWLHFLPSAEGLNRTSQGIREYLGRVYYKVKIAS